MNHLSSFIKNFSLNRQDLSCPVIMGKNKVLPQKTTLLSFFSATSTSSTSKTKVVATPTNSGSKGTVSSNSNEIVIGQPADLQKQNERSEQMRTPKRLKYQDPEMCDEQNNSPEAVSTPLTPEQKKMIQNKGLSAKLLKTSQSLKILDQQMGTSWFSALEDEFKKDYFRELNDFVLSARSRATVFPPHPHVWEWTKQTEINAIRVVILGQDPYHGPNQAHGLCFSVKKGVAPPPSLVNMYKELESDIPGFKIPNHGCLSGWSEQGVLLLNAVLTVESGKANAHKDKGWEKITDSVISWISKNLDSVVFLLWGAYAQKKAAMVDKKKHHLLQAVHPSPLSAHRGFFGCKHFSKCNQLLMENGKQPVDWNRLP